jgi:S-adenosylmethionine:tRNA ribosyltransferase-isomerase
MRTEELDYELPSELIALEPVACRSAARLLVDRNGTTDHATVADLPTLLRAGDLLVFNDTKVLPARFELTRHNTGGRVEGLYLGADEHGERMMLKSGGRLVSGEVLSEADEPVLKLIQTAGDGIWSVESLSDERFVMRLDRIGTMPLPPYIRSRRDTEVDLDATDRRRYQTVFAREAGAVAAPTAGLHFDQPLLDQLQAAGVLSATVTLHVGLGTFSPVRADRLEDHAMHGEHFRVSAKTIEQLQAARADNRRIIPVGTTCVRALESLPESLEPKDYDSVATLLIQPPYSFRFADGLMTNFHLPRSTLLALVAARVGLDRLRELYAEAIDHAYRFYSYGDAMIYLPG